jgi:hypothetical protein
MSISRSARERERESLTEKVNFQFSASQKEDGEGRKVSSYSSLTSSLLEQQQTAAKKVFRPTFEGFTVIFSKMNSLLCGRLDVFGKWQEKNFSLPPSLSY